MVAAAQTALLRFDHEEHGDFQPVAGETEVLAKKRRAGLNKLDLLAKKVRAEEKRSLRPNYYPESCELDNRLATYHAEYEARCDGMSNLTVAARGPQPQGLPRMRSLPAGNVSVPTLCSCHGLYVALRMPDTL